MATRRRAVLVGGLGLVAIVSVLIRFFNPPEECPVTSATEQDFAEAIAIGEGVFEPEIWELKYGEHPSLISVGWFDYVSEGIAHSQYVLYNCGYTQTVVDNFYGDAGMDVMLGGYNTHTLTAQCEQDGVMLREYALDYAGKPFMMRFWIQPVNATRVRDIHLAFSVDDDAMMEDYAARLFPNFASCNISAELSGG
ncbi:MAG: hypothetical protein K8L97_19545 [Anaerolineae bacterium]|nr:hypothetical protein [Anaerolineae bacterium]